MSNWGANFFALHNRFTDSKHQNDLPPISYVVK